MDDIFDVYSSLNKCRGVQEYNIKCGKMFLATKKMEGCSPETMELYMYMVNRYISYCNKIKKKVSVCQSNDIRIYLINYQNTNNCSDLSKDNVRRVLSSFYHYLEEEMIIIHNPMDRIHKIRYEKTIKAAFSDEEIEKIREYVKNDIRDCLIVEFLLATGVRVSELCNLKISDIDLERREALIFGKGRKERIVYFDARTKMRIIRYLEYRDKHDIESEWLFLGKRSPFKQLEKNGVEVEIRKIGIATGIEKCHPHRFRRTFATYMLKRGMPIEQVRVLMGHVKIDTTLIYAEVDHELTRINYQRCTI